jgi:hypothetical protein
MMALRSVLIVSEIALACVLLVGAGLLLRSFLRILDVDLGFKPSRAASISLDYNDGNDAGKRSVIWQEALRRVEAIPGVETAGITDNLPMSRNRRLGYLGKGQELSSQGNWKIRLCTLFPRVTSTRLACTWLRAVTFVGTTPTRSWGRSSLTKR